MKTPSAPPDRGDNLAPVPPEVVGDDPSAGELTAAGSGHALRDAGEREPTLRQHVARILWPAFLAAGVLEMLVFAVVDPGDLRWFGAAPIDWPATAVYTVTFFIFWAGVATAGALTTLLSLPAAEINAFDADAGHRVRVGHPRAEGLREATMDDQVEAAAR